MNNIDAINEESKEYAITEGKLREVGLYEYSRKYWYEIFKAEQKQSAGVVEQLIQQDDKAPMFYKYGTSLGIKITDLQRLMSFAKDILTSQKQVPTDKELDKLAWKESKIAYHESDNQQYFKQNSFVKTFIKGFKAALKLINYESNTQASKSMDTTQG